LMSVTYMICLFCPEGRLRLLAGSAESRGFIDSNVPRQPLAQALRS
jgi:hypothetical protein